jgi:hypothetical protein
MSSLPGMLPDSGPGSRSRRRWFIGIFVGLILIVLITLRAVLLPFMLAVVFAYVLSPVVSAGERLKLGNNRPRRWVVVVALYAVLVSGLVGLIAVSVPRLTAELQRLTREAPRLVATVRSEWLPQLDAVLRAATDPYLAPNERVDLPVAVGTPDAISSAAPLKPPVANAPAPLPAYIARRPSDSTANTSDMPSPEKSPGEKANRMFCHPVASCVRVPKCPAPSPGSR